MSLKVDLDYVLKLNRELLAIPSVGGDCYEAMDRCESEFKKFGLKPTHTNKGALIASMNGGSDEGSRLVGAHVDTLGAIVRSIKPNGRLRLFGIGGFSWGFYEAENLWIRTSEGKMIRGCLLPDMASRHAYGDACTIEQRLDDNVEVRIDEDTSSVEETRALGIDVGDFVFFDHRLEESASGYIKSRYLDDKVCLAAMFGAIRALTEAGIKPSRKVYFNVSNYEEKGHGISYVPEDVVECLSLDVGIVAPSENASEKAVSIVARDSRTPYDFRFRKHLTDLAQVNKIPYRICTPKNYGSDASVGVLAGKDFNFACIGPGVDASHHYERTHRTAVQACGDLLLAYLCD